MAKGLPIVAILGALSAALVVAILVDAAIFAVLPILIAGSIVLVMERNTAGAVGGIVALLFAVLAALGMAGSITTKDSGSTDFGMTEATGRLWAAAGCLAIPAAAAFVRRDAFAQEWLGYVAMGLPVLALVLAFTQRAHFADQSRIMVLIASAVALACIWPMVVLLRSSAGTAPESDEPAS